MKYAFFLLAFMACVMTTPLGAQVVGSGSEPATVSDGDINDVTDAEMMGLPLSAGEHVPQEIIIRYEVAPALSEREGIEDFLKDLDIFVLEWSPSGKYIRAATPEFTTCQAVNGNPQTVPDTEGEGDQVSLNFIVGTYGWEHNEDLNEEEEECINDQEEPGAFDDYSPTDGCSSDASLLPTVGSQSVRVAIIDSGQKGGAQGYRNGVAYKQVVIPGDCTGEDCEPITEGISALSNSFHRHGTYIYDLISGWFRSKNMQSQLSITSYRVLDENVRGTLFQVVKALEMATDQKDPPHIITMSLGFKEYVCKPSGKNNGNSNPEPKGKFTGEKDNYVPNILTFAIEDAQERDIIVICSAGNSQADIQQNPQYPASERGIRNLVPVGALNCGENSIASFSNYSALYVKLFAPGSRINILSGDCYRTVSGTSFACPIVAAKAAFHVTNQSVYDDEEVLCFLRSQGDPFPYARWGIVNTNTNQFDCEAVLEKEPGKAKASSNIVGIAPNPFDDVVTVSLPPSPQQRSTSLILYDQAGRQVMKREVYGVSSTLSLEHLKSGAYWLKIVSAEHSATKKLIKR